MEALKITLKIVLVLSLIGLGVTNLIDHHIKTAILGFCYAFANAVIFCWPE